MRTNIVIDDSLMSEAKKVSKMKTKRAVIEQALIEFIENRKRLDIRKLKGKIHFREDYDYKELRRL